MAIGFQQVGALNGITGEADVIGRPTSLQFGPDGRLYVSEQDGTINVLTVAIEDDEYVVTEKQVLLLPDGGGVVKSLQNHDDDGTPNNANNLSKRQVTGILTAGTAENPVLYISSSDPRISFFGESNLDTNSGILTRVTWTGSEWEAVDLVRGLPRSEENHSNNGMVLSEDGTKLYLTVGGNTNNGAPSEFFSYLGEYALSGTLLEIDLEALDAIVADNGGVPFTDPNGGRDGRSRQYIYDLPTLDDPNVPNDGVREDANGMDVANPWGGNDGLNMAILPADAPLRIYADGFRNHFDVVLTESGQLYTVDNGSNGGNLGGNPLDANGLPTNNPAAGEATSQPNDGGTGDQEPLFLIEENVYYGHPAPARANQNLPWTVYNDDGEADTNVPFNSVADLSALVPDGVQIADGFLIDPSKFTSDPDRLSESGIRVEREAPQSEAIALLGSSSNGLVEYTSDAFGGALQGGLLVAQFNKNITFLNLSDDGTTLEPVVDPGEDEIFGTPDDAVVDADGIFFLPLDFGDSEPFSQPLDVTVGPGGTLWVADLSVGQTNPKGEIRVFAPTGEVIPGDPDADNDGILNINDPFVLDATNGGLAVVEPGSTLIWDFDPDQDDNLVGPSGYGGGLTGVMVNGVTDYDLFLRSESSPGSPEVNLDNIKFTTAAGGGTTVIEEVANGNPLLEQNDGEYLFHTGVTIAPTVDDFTVTWTVINPAATLTGPSQQIGGYIGTGDQSNYLKIVATQNPLGEIEIILENEDAEGNDVVLASSYIQADDLFDVPPNQRIFFQLNVDPSAGTATPSVTYETGSGETTVAGTPLDLTGTNILEAISGNYTVEGQTTGVAVGLFASNTGQPPEATFQAVFENIEVTATGSGSASTILYRVNAGGPQIIATDGGPNWSADTAANPSAFLLDTGNGEVASFPAVDPGATVPAAVPGAIFNTERSDQANDTQMQWAFDAPTAGLYEVRLYLGNGDPNTNAAGDRVYDIALEGTVPNAFDNIDLTEQFGNEVGGVLTNTIQVTDGTLNLDFVNGIGDPLVNGIEILLLEEGVNPPVGPGAAIASINRNDTNVQKSNFSPSSFQVTNTGDKAIAKVEIDVTDALYPDSVFDPFGVAGDTVAKQLVIDTNGGTGVIAPSASTYIGPGGTAGFDAIQLLFDENVNDGFEPGETLAFSIDMDPNSVAGAQKGLLDAGTVPPWDVGGVSGAELIGSTVTITFEDGTTATSQLQGNNNQAGSQTLVSQNLPDLEASLLVNGLAPGNIGTYSQNGPSVVVNGPAGQTARVVLTKGFIQPVTNEFFNGSPAQQAYAPTLQAQLDALAAANFPANNAVEFQTVDVVLTGEEQDISDLFDFDNVANFNFAGEDQLPLGFVASIIDPDNEDLPLGPVTQPTYLQFQEVTQPAVTIEAESLTGDAVTGYRLENNPLASDGQMLTLEGGQEDEIGTLTFTFDGEPGVLYDVIIGTFDESDGVATFEVTQNNDSFTTFTLDQDSGDANPSVANQVEVVAFANIAIANGDTFTITGTEDGGDSARLDFIRFEPVGTLQSLPPTITTPSAVDVVENQLAVFDINASDANGDAEGDGLTYSLTGGLDQAAFAIDANTGVLSFAALPDFEQPGDSNSDNIYQVDVTVTDSTALTTTQTINVTVTDGPEFGETVLYRVNAGGPEVAAIDGGLSWAADLQAANNPSLIDPGNNNTSGFPAVNPGVTVPNSVPGTIFDTERFDFASLTDMEWGFDVAAAGLYEVRLYAGNGFGGTSDPGERVFDVAVEGEVPNVFDDIDLSAQFGHQVGGVLTTTVQVTDGTLNLEFLREVENPLINGIEIVQLVASTPNEVNLLAAVDATEPTADGQFTINLSEAADTDTVISYTVGGTATAAEDYATLSGTVTILAGELSAPIDVTVLDDELVESSETVVVTLDAVTAGDANVVLGASDTATVNIADDDEATADVVLYRVNAGGPEVNAIDGGLSWAADLQAANNQALIAPGSNNVASFPTVGPGVTVPDSVPDVIFTTERFDFAGGTEMGWGFDVAEAGLYEVRLYAGNGFAGTNDPGERVYDVAVEGEVPSAFDDIDLSAQFGHQVGGVLTTTVQVTDGTLNLEFLREVENPLINGIEIVQLAATSTPNEPNEVNLLAPVDAAEPTTDGQFTVTLSEVANTDTVIDYVVSGTATADDDYEALSGTVTILAGESSASIDVAVLDDALVEDDETVAVTLTTITAGDDNIVLGTSDTAAVTIADDDEPVATSTVLYRVNAGGPEVAAIDGGLSWAADLEAANNPSLIDPGNNNTAGFPAVNPGVTVPDSVPETIFDTERFDFANLTDMEWGFDVAEAGLYEVRLYAGNGFGGTSDPGERVFDVAVEGEVPNAFDDIDLSAQFGHQIGGVLTTTVQVTDGTLNLEFLREVENPLINGIEIVQLGTSSPTPNPNPNPNPNPVLSPVRLEAEDAAITPTYRLDNLSVASGDQILSFRGGASNETGSATFSFDATAGEYDLIVGTFDENDGIAQFTVELNDLETGTTTEVGALVLDDDLGFNFGNAQTAINPVVATGLALTPGDTITVNGFEQGGEFARLDFIELVPTA